MKCKDCAANNGSCLLGVKNRMLVCGSYGCDLQKRIVEKRLGIYKQTNYDTVIILNAASLAIWLDEHTVNWEKWCDKDAPVDADTLECAKNNGECWRCILDWLEAEAGT